MRWFKKNNYPDVWEAYAASFASQSLAMADLRFVVLDTETTGLSVAEDRILSIGAIGIRQQRICMDDVLESFVEQHKFSRETVEIHGIRKSTHNKQSEEAALFDFLAYANNAVLVGHHVGFDVAMLNQALKRRKLPKLKNTVLDTGNLHLKTLVDVPQKRHFSLDELSQTYRIPLHDRHNACGDAYITAQLFIKILKKLQKNNTLTLSYLKRSAIRTGLL